jgi:hypothetical protein
MATFVEQGHYAPTFEKQVFSAIGAVVYTLTSGANGTALTGSGDVMVVTSSEAGWIHVSTTVNTDKAATVKTHRVLANIPRQIGGVMKGNFVSFFAEA